jgi:hypothetical protein
MTASLEQRISELLNEFCEENHSNTPDWVLAKFLKGSLDQFHLCTNLREQYYGRMADAMESDEDLLQFSAPTIELNGLNLNDECPTNFLEENGFEQLEGDITDLSTLCDCVTRPGLFYGYTDEDELVVIKSSIWEGGYKCEYLVYPTIERVLEMMESK